MNQQRADPEIPGSVSMERRIWGLTISRAADRSNSRRAEERNPGPWLKIVCTSILDRKDRSETNTLFTHQVNE